LCLVLIAMLLEKTFWTMAQYSDS